MRQKQRTFEEIYDVIGIRCIIPDDRVKDCYGVLGIIHAMWHPIPGEFDDYIATPKQSMYRSLHTAVIGPEGHALEIQIRTQRMHEIAEFGVAAHWRYKEGKKADAKVEAKVAWLRQMLEWQAEMKDAEEFVETVKSDVLEEMIYVFTPKGDIIELPAGATPLDFAYRIHTEVGHHTVRAKVNDQLVRLDTKLKNGQVVEISTSKTKLGPSRDWLREDLGYLTTASAKEKIRQWFRRQEREENIAQGKEILEKELRRLGVDLKPEDIHKHFPRYNKVEDMIAAIGYGAISPQLIASRLGETETKKVLSDTPHVPKPRVPLRLDVMGVGDLLTSLATCCKPVNGDAIVGYVTRGRGITVHRADCPNLRQPARSRAADPGHLGVQGRRDLPGQHHGPRLGSGRPAQGHQHAAGGREGQHPLRPDRDQRRPHRQPADHDRSRKRVPAQPRAPQDRERAGGRRSPPRRQQRRGRDPTRRRLTLWRRRSSVLSLGEVLIDMIVSDGSPTLEDAAEFMARPGGAPANVAVALRRLGVPSAFCGAVGDDPFGARLRRYCRPMMSIPAT